MPSEAIPLLDELTYSTVAELIKFLDRPARLFIDTEEWEQLVLYIPHGPQYDAGGPYFFVLGTRVYPAARSYTRTVTIKPKLRKFDADNDPR